MRRLSAAVAVVSLALVISSCGNAEITGNTDKKPSKAAKALLSAGPNPSCRSTASVSARRAYLIDNPALTDDQLSIVCPDLFPADYKADKKYDQYKRSREAPSSTGGTPPGTSTTPGTRTTPTTPRTTTG